MGAAPPQMRHTRAMHRAPDRRRAGVLAIGVALLASGCSRDTEPTAQSVTVTVTPTPAGPAITAPVTTAPATTAPATTAPATTAPATAAPATTAPPKSAPRSSPLQAAKLVRQLPACAGGGCAVLAEFPTGSAKVLHFALVGLPGFREAEDVGLKVMALFDVSTEKLTWSSEMETGRLLVLGRPGVASQDALGHISVSVLFGPHAVRLYVFDPADGVIPKFFGPDDGGWVSNDADAHAEDLDGDGIFEIVVSTNPYDPSYAGGPTTVSRFRWNGSDYASMGCTVHEDDGVTKKELPAGDPGCL